MCGRPPRPRGSAAQIPFFPSAAEAAGARLTRSDSAEARPRHGDGRGGDHARQSLYLAIGSGAEPRLSDQVSCTRASDRHSVYHSRFNNLGGILRRIVLVACGDDSGRDDSNEKNSEKKREQSQNLPRSKGQRLASIAEQPASAELTFHPRVKRDWRGPTPWYRGPVPCSDVVATRSQLPASFLHCASLSARRSPDKGEARGSSRGKGYWWHWGVGWSPSPTWWLI